jgi:hypothetical protein
MMGQPTQPQSAANGSSTEFALIEKAFNTWNIEINDAPQAIFSCRLYGSNTLVFGVYCTPNDHPAVGTSEAWNKDFETAYKGKQRQVSDLAGQGLCCADPVNGQIKGILFSAIETLSETKPEKKNDSVYLEWVLEKLRWLWRQAFADKPYPTIIRTTELPSAMFFDEQCRAEFPSSTTDAWLPLLFDISSEKRQQGMAAFTQTEDRTWLATIFRVLWREANPHVIDTAMEVIVHFKAQHEAAVYFVKKLQNDQGMSDRFSNTTSIARDRNVLRRLGGEAVAAMLQGLEPPKGSAINDLLDILSATGDARVQPALEALVRNPKTPEWERRLITPVLNKLSGKPS